MDRRRSDAVLQRSATIAKVVKDYRAALPEAAIYMPTTTPPTDGRDCPRRRHRSCATSGGRVKKRGRTMFREIDAGAI